MLDENGKVYSEPLWADANGVISGYMCKVDFEYELGGAKKGNRVFPSIKALEEALPCTKYCGIVEVEVRLKSVIRESDFQSQIAKAKERALKELRDTPTDP